MHYTTVFLAVPEVETMPQFVQGFLDCPVVEVFPRHFRAEIFTQPVCRDQTGAALQLCFPVYVREYRNIQVDIGYSQNLDKFRGQTLGKCLQDSRGIVLAALRIESKLQILEQGRNPGLKSKKRGYFFLDRQEQGVFNLPQGCDKYLVAGC